jgi:hypothetical protein
MKASELLILTRENYASPKRKSSYICSVVDRVCPNNKKAQCARDKVVNHIQRLLGRHYTLGRWLQEKGFVPPNNIDNYDPRMIATRLAWLDDMIQYFETKGD